MSTIGSLAVNVTANTEKFSRGMKSARKDLSAFESGISKAGGLIAGFGATLAAGFSVNSLRATADEVSRLVDDSTKLGIATGKLQGLERFAELSGSNASAVVAGIGKMQVSINKGADSFAMLGLEAAKLKAMKPEEAFLNIADAIKKIGNPNERMAAIKDIFGKGGADLLPTIMDSDLRGGVSKYGTISDDAARDIEAAGDAATKLGFAFDDLKIKILAGVVPGFTKLVEMLDKLPGMGSNLDLPITGGPAVAGDSTFWKIMSQVSPYFGTLHAESKALGSGPRIAKFKKTDPVRTAEDDWLDAMDSVSHLAKMFAESADHTTDLLPDWVLNGTGPLPEMPRGFSAKELRRMQDAADDAHSGTPIGDYFPTRRRPEVSSNAALEQGTAAAFSQGNRSQQAANQMLDVNRQQLKSLQKTETTLKDIDRNLRATAMPVTVNIA